MTDMKATVNDDISGVVLGEDGLRTVTQLTDNTYETGEWPKDFI